MPKRAAEPSQEVSVETQGIDSLAGSQPPASDGGNEPAGTPSPNFRASFFTSNYQPLPPEFVLAVKDLEVELGLSVWLCVHNDKDSSLGDPSRCSAIDLSLTIALKQALRKLPRGKKFAVLVHSPGGFSRSAYQAASLLRRHCGGYTAIVPTYAKSAATLFCLGAETLLLGEHAELGPLDVQVYDTDRDAMRSALDEVQALERLQAFALEAMDASMFVLVERSGKSVDKLLPLALDLSMDMVRPLIEKIDTVHFTQASRQLKEAEEYAVRLLTPRFSESEAHRIASHLVEKYPEHGFVIDSREAKRVGLKLAKVSVEIRDILDAISESMPRMNALGFLEEVEP